MKNNKVIDNLVATKVAIDTVFESIGELEYEDFFNWLKENRLDEGCVYPDGVELNYQFKEWTVSLAASVVLPLHFDIKHCNRRGSQVTQDEEAKTTILNCHSFFVRGELIELEDNLEDDPEYDYVIEKRGDFIEQLISWMAEEKRHDYILMKDDLEMLLSRDDEFMLSSTRTNDYIFEGDAKFENELLRIKELVQAVSIEITE